MTRQFRQAPLEIRTFGVVARLSDRQRIRGAGFGVATGYQDPRTLQIQLRFQF